MAVPLFLEFSGKMNAARFFEIPGNPFDRVPTRNQSSLNKPCLKKRRIVISYRSQAGTLVDGVVALALPLLALALRLLALALRAPARVPPDRDHLVLLMLDRGAGKS
jgi:hypothetical protein